jgi:hypothetical protein
MKNESSPFQIIGILPKLKRDKKGFVRWKAIAMNSGYESRKEAEWQATEGCISRILSADFCGFVVIEVDKNGNPCEQQKQRGVTK